jgi:hypothetical protein
MKLFVAVIILAIAICAMSMPVDGSDSVTNTLAETLREKLPKGFIKSTYNQKISTSIFEKIKEYGEYFAETFASLTHPEPVKRSDVYYRDFYKLRF